MKIILFLLFAFWLWALILSIADKNKKQTIKSQENRRKIIAFLEKNGEARTAEIAKAIGLSTDRTRVILAGMVELEALGGNRNRTYRLKS